MATVSWAATILISAFTAGSLSAGRPLLTHSDSRMLMAKAKAAKEMLTTEKKATIHAKISGDRIINVTITREVFDSITASPGGKNY